MEKQKAYMNPMQREVAVVNPRDAIIVAGRGTGKGRVQALRLLNAVQAMPRCTCAFVAPNTIRAMTNILPSITMHWEEWGYKRGVHWEIGRRPPAKLDWPRPIIEPLNYDSVISFYTGAVVQIISQDRAGTSNSKSFDYIAIDEAKFIKFDQLKDETFQANRGQEREFGHCFLHHGMTITSDLPITKAGSWFLNYEDKMDRDIIGAIIGAVQRRNDIRTRQATDPNAPDYLNKELRAIDRHLNTLRRHALFYNVYSTLTNIEVLGAEYIKQMKRDLPPLVFYTSILCRRVKQLRDGFYSSMSERHLYTAANFNYLDSLNYQFADLTPMQDSRIDADLNPDLPLCIAFDYNRNINWLVVGQADEELQRMNTIKAFFVKYERKLPELIDDFCRYYQHLPVKRVVYYYDSTALGSNYAVNDTDFRRVVEQGLRKHGWTVTAVYLGNPMNHAEKHLLINQGFAGDKRLTPYFNEENCADLLISIQTAGVYNGKKDKRGEKLAETEEDRLESRTDGSDAWDTLYIGCELKPQRAMLIVPTSNWR